MSLHLLGGSGLCLSGPCCKNKVPLGLTGGWDVQEQKKLRKQRREAKEKEKQTLIRQGLLEPPKPKVILQPCSALHTT